MTTPVFEPYDQAAYERFCAALVGAGFSPVPGSNRQRWFGPLPDFLSELTDSDTMQVHFGTGWPLRCAQPVVAGLNAGHVADGIICLWSDDDPAQVTGSEYDAWMDRLRAWAEKAIAGEFGREDQALDAFMAYRPRNDMVAELPLEDLVAPGSNGYRHPLDARVQGRILRVGDQTGGDLRGALYLRGRIKLPPRNFDEFKALLTRKQLEELERGFADRAPTALNEPSGGLDFAVLAWPRFDGQHDAVVLGFQGRGASFEASVFRVAPSDMKSLSQRAGPNFGALQSKAVLQLGTGSVGGYVAELLAASGVKELRPGDDDVLLSPNVVRHVCGADQVGEYKVVAVADDIDRDSPWCDVQPCPQDLDLIPSRIRDFVKDYDVVVDCTGMFSVTAALAIACEEAGVPFVTGALFHQGAVLRVRRQAPGDVAILQRSQDPDRWPAISPEPAVGPDFGFLELGCTAPVNNAPPASVLRAAADIVATVIDELTGRRDLDAEQVTVLRPLADAPFDRVGPVHGTAADDDDQEGA